MRAPTDSTCGPECSQEAVLQVNLPATMSVIVPAHNEEAVIGRCLRGITDGSLPGEFEIVVVCNGCSDSTAARARSTAPDATVVELGPASKSDALNAGDRLASVFPRAYVDADVVVTVSTLRALREALSRVPCAAPAPRFQKEGRPWVVRRFYDAWERLPYLNDHMVGSGVYALSASGRSRFDSFPPITADDQFVMQSFGFDEREVLKDHGFSVETPRTLGDLIRVRTRVYRGNRELARSGAASHPPTGAGAKAVFRELAFGSQFADMATYAAVNLLAKGKARTSASRWERDESSRRHALSGASEGAPEPAPRVAYVVSRYPSPSHSFIRQEVEDLRLLGFDIKTFTVRASHEVGLLSPEDQRASETTEAILPANIRSLLSRHARAFARSPRAYRATFVQACRQSPPGAKAAVWQLFYFAEAMLLWARCDEAGYRHVHAHFANVGADLAWLAASFGARADPTAGWRWSFTMHGPTEFFSVERYNLARKAEAASRVICISEYCRSQLMAHTRPEHWEKFSVAHCGVDLERFSPTARHTHAGAGLEVVCVGRLVPEKGQRVLLEAVADLAQRGVMMTLTLAGDGPERARLEDLAESLGLSDRVSFAGTIPHDQVRSLLGDKDVFCLPSFAEGVPVVLMEAMACELPTVSTEVAGIPELIEHGDSGLLVPPGRTDLLGEALATLAGDPGLRRSLGRRGRQRVASAFEASRCAREVAGLLASDGPAATLDNGAAMRHAS